MCGLWVCVCVCGLVCACVCVCYSVDNYLLDYCLLVLHVLSYNAQKRTDFDLVMDTTFPFHIHYQVVSTWHKDLPCNV